MNIHKISHLEQHQKESDREQRRKQVLKSIQASKPEEPVFDTERADKFKDIARNTFLTEAFSALAEGILRARSDHKDQPYAVLPSGSGFGDIGLASVDQLQTLDKDYRKKLDEFRKNILDYNTYRQKQLTRFDKNENKISADLRKQYLDAAERFIIAKDLETAKELMRKAGLVLPYTPETKSNTSSSANIQLGDTPPPTNIPVATQENSLSGDNLGINNPPTVSSPVPASTLLTVQQAIEQALADDPDPETQKILLERWKNATRDYLTAHSEVDENSVEWWTENLFEDLKRDLKAGKLQKEKTSIASNPTNSNRRDTGFIGLFNRMAKIATQPIIGKENRQELERLIGGDPGTAPSWPELWDSRRENYPEMLKEYLVQPPVDSVANMNPDQAKAELQTVREAQQAINNYLYGGASYDLQTGKILNDRWIDFERRANQLLGVIQKDNQTTDENNNRQFLPNTNEAEKNVIAASNKAIMKSIIENPDRETLEILTKQWLNNNRKLLEMEGIPAELFDEFNKNMFETALQKVKTTPGEKTNQPESGSQSGQPHLEIQDMKSTGNF